MQQQMSLILKRKEKKDLIQRDTLYEAPWFPQWLYDPEGSAVVPIGQSSRLKIEIGCHRHSTNTIGQRLSQTRTQACSWL